MDLSFRSDPKFKLEFRINQEFLLFRYSDFKFPYQSHFSLIEKFFLYIDNCNKVFSAIRNMGRILCCSDIFCEAKNITTTSFSHLIQKEVDT